MAGRLNPFLKTLSRGIRETIFPPLCAHCSEPVEQSRHLICKTCFDLLSLIDPKERCSLCFAKKQEGRGCHTCPTQRLKVAAACLSDGPLGTLLHQLKHQGRFALAPALAPLLAMQWSCLKWPRPDLIVPVPQSLSERLLSSYNPGYLLATALGRLLHIPVVSLLKRQAAFPPPDSFTWRAHASIADKTLLLVDDLHITGATLRAAAARLQEEAPSNLYALTLAVTE